MITRTDLAWWLDLEPRIDWQYATTYAEGARRTSTSLHRVAPG